MRQQKHAMSRSPSSDHESNQLVKKIINGNMNSLKAIALGQIERENLQYSPQNSKTKQIDQYNSIGLPEQALNVNRMHLEKRAKKMIKIAPQQNTQGTGIDILNTFDDITADLNLQSQQIVRPDTIEQNIAHQQFDPLHQYPFNTKLVFPNLQIRQPNINIRDDDIMHGTLKLRDQFTTHYRTKSTFHRSQYKQSTPIQPESLSNINEFIVESNIRLVEKKTEEGKAEVQMKVDLNQPDKLPNIGLKSEFESMTDQASQFNRKQTSLPPPPLQREAPPKSAISKMSNFKYQRNSGMNHTTNGFSAIRPKLVNLHENTHNNQPAGSMRSKYPEGDDDSPVPDPHNSGARIVNIKHTSPETQRGDQSTQQKYRHVWIDKKEHQRLLMRSPANNKDLQYKYRLHDPGSELQNEPEMSVMGSQGLTEFPSSMPQSNFDLKDVKSSNIKIINDAIIKNGQFKSLSNRYGYMGGLNGVQGYTGHGRKGSQVEQHFQGRDSPSKQQPGKNLFSIQPDLFGSKRFSQIQQLSPSNKLLNTIGINEHQLSGRIKAMKTSQQDLQEKEVDKQVADHNEQSFSNMIIQERISPIHVRRLKENIDRNKKIEEEEEGETDFLDQLEKSVEFKGKTILPSDICKSPTSTTYGNKKSRIAVQRANQAQAAFNQMQYSFYSSKTQRKMSHGGTVSASMYNQKYLVNKDLTDSAIDARQLNVDSALSRMSDGFTGRKLTHQQLQQMLMKTPKNLPGFGFRSINSSLDSNKISKNIKNRHIKKTAKKQKDINNFSFEMRENGEQQKSNGILKNPQQYNIDAILRHSSLSKNADKVNNHFENIDQAKLKMYDQIKPIINQHSKQNSLRDSQKKIDLEKYENGLLKHDHVRRSSQGATDLKKTFEEIQNQLNEQSDDGNSPRVLVSKEVSAAQFPDLTEGPRGAQTSYQSIKTFASRVNTKQDFQEVASLAKDGRAVQSLLTIHNQIQSSPSKSSKKVIKLQVHDQMKNPQTKRIFDTYKGTVIKSEGKSESGYDHDSSVAENFKKRNSGGDLNDIMSNQSENKNYDTPIGQKEAKFNQQFKQNGTRNYELRLDFDRESMNHGNYQYQQSPETSLNLQGKSFTYYQQKEAPIKKYNRQQNKDLTQNYKQFQTIQGNSPTNSIKMPKNVKISFRHQSDLTKKKSPVETKKDKAKIKKQNSSKAFLRINNIDLTALAGQKSNQKQQRGENWVRYKEEKAIAQRQQYEEQLRQTFNNSTQFPRKLNRENSSYAQNSSVRLPDDVHQKLRANNISLNVSQEAVPSAHLFRKHSRNTGFEFQFKTLQMTQDQMHELAQKKINSDINSLTKDYEQFQSQKKAQNKTHQAGFYRQHKNGKTVVLNNTVTNPLLGMPKITIQNEDHQDPPQSSGSRTNHMFLQNGQADSRPVTEERDHLGGGSKMQMSPNYHEVVNNHFPQAQLPTDQQIMTDIMPQIFSNQMIQGVKNNTRTNSAYDSLDKSPNGELPNPTAKLVTELQESLQNNRNNTRMFEIQQKINQLSMMTNMNPQHLENQILPLLLQNQKQSKGIFVPKPQLPKQLKMKKKKRSQDRKPANPEEEMKKSLKSKIEPIDMIHMRNRRHTMATKPKESTRQIAATHAFTKKNNAQYKTDVIYNNDMSHLQI